MKGIRHVQNASESRRKVRAGGFVGVDSSSRSRCSDSEDQEIRRSGNPSDQVGAAAEAALTAKAL